MLVYRHKLPIRMMHWINVLCFIVLFMSGLNIFNAHPALYFAKSSYTNKPPFFQISSQLTSAGQRIGITNINGFKFNTTGVLGVSTAANGATVNVGFPAWITIPSSRWLAMARHWHFFFAWLFVINGACYLAYSFFTKHIQRDLALTKQDKKSIWASVKQHLQFKHPTGEDALQYNVLQKIAYLSVIFILLPLIILMGMGMSPFLNSLMPGWVDIFGGRQAARSIHFIVAWLMLGFIFIHLLMVLITGLWNNVRSMITGYYLIDRRNGGRE